MKTEVPEEICRHHRPRGQRHHVLLSAFSAPRGLSWSGVASSAAVLVSGQQAMSGRSGIAVSIRAHEQPHGWLGHVDDVQHQVGDLGGVLAPRFPVRLIAIAAPTVAAYSSRTGSTRIDDPAQSVRMPPGSNTVILMPSGPDRWAPRPRPRHRRSGPRVWRRRASATSRTAGSIRAQAPATSSAALSTRRMFSPASLARSAPDHPRSVRAANSRGYPDTSSRPSGMASAPM
jgi:hypothetical protein